MSHFEKDDVIENHKDHFSGSFFLQHPDQCGEFGAGLSVCPTYAKHKRKIFIFAKQAFEIFRLSLVVMRQRKATDGCSDLRSARQKGSSSLCPERSKQDEGLRFTGGSSRFSRRPYALTCVVD